jgi:hypothetical protein
MNMQDPMHEQPRATYGGYEGPREYAQQQRYDTPYTQSPGATYDDNFIEALAQRIAQRMGPGSQGKLSIGGSQIPAGLRLALAIVSVVMLVPLSAILVAGSPAPAGFLAFICACAAIAIINAVFNGVIRR